MAAKYHRLDDPKLVDDELDENDCYEGEVNYGELAAGADLVMHSVTGRGS